jgi:exopolysaccharide biosynthesis predicted pyruvyltransferase EpsI
LRASLDADTCDGKSQGDGGVDLISEAFSAREAAILQRLQHGPTHVDPEFLVKVSAFLKRHDGPIYLFGFSPFTNLGDHALWSALVRLLGEIDSIKIKGALSRAPISFGGVERDALVIFPGGGSLGNRYTSSKARVELIEAMRPRAILQMPVSTTFADPGAVSVDRVSRAYQSAKDGLFFVRDSQSYEEANRVLGINVELAPDLSALLPSMSDLADKGGGTLYLLRQDQEADGKLIAPSGSMATDWNQFNKTAPDDLKAMNQQWWQGARRWAVFKPFNTASVLKRREVLATRIADAQTTRALALLGGFDRIVTDRLHGMLLANKLGIPCVAIDNDHNKLSRYAKTWLDCDHDNIRFCDLMEQVG